MEASLSLIPFLAVVALVALSGAVFKPGVWYKSLDKPPWTPPDWLFPVAWTSLYIMIAVAGWIVWRVEGLQLALCLWTANLVLNGMWSWLMFGRRRIDYALIDAVGMLVTIAGFMVTSWTVSGWAALLFLPYLIWVGFAVALNWAILQRNGKHKASAVSG